MHQGVLQVKSIINLVFEVRKFMKPYDFLLIPTIKHYCTFNDIYIYIYIYINIL